MSLILVMPAVIQSGKKRGLSLVEIKEFINSGSLRIPVSDSGDLVRVRSIL